MRLGQNLLQQGAAASGGSYDVMTAAFVQTLSLGYGSTTGLDFDATGTKMFIGEFGGDTVKSYSLSSSWDISTASYISGADLSTVGRPQSIFWSSNGFRFTSADRLDGFRDYVCATQYDLTTVLSSAFISNSTPGSLRTMFTYDDETKAAVTENFGDNFILYDLATQGVLASIQTPGTEYNFSPVDLESTGISANGLLLFGSQDGASTIYQWPLSVANDISTYGTPETKTFSEFTLAREAVYGDNGRKFYVLDDGNVHEYNLT